LSDLSVHLSNRVILSSLSAKLSLPRNPRKTLKLRSIHHCTLPLSQADKAARFSVSVKHFIRHWRVARCDAALTASGGLPMFFVTAYWTQVVPVSCLAIRSRCWWVVMSLTPAGLAFGSSSRLMLSALAKIVAAGNRSVENVITLRALDLTLFSSRIVLRLGGMWQHARDLIESEIARLGRTTSIVARGVAYAN